ncbi:FAD/NAD-binding family oxidoreductase [soil metagenome]
MATFTTKLIQKDAITDNITAFHFEKTEGFMYKPGQHATLRLVNAPAIDDEGNERTLSLTTIPSDNSIGFATRIRDSAFKQNLKNMAIGETVEVSDPRGGMVLPNDTSRPLVFFAGGIGITPFISMIREAAKNNFAQKITFFYANQTTKQAAFLDELTSIKKTHSAFTFVPTITREDPMWLGEKGHITSSMIKKYIPDTENTIFYLAGPQALVTGVTEVLNQLGVDSLFIRSEDFGEYK